METLIDGFDDESKRRYQDKDGMYRDVGKLLCANFDADQRVVEIKRYSSVSESIQLCDFPPKIESFVSTDTQLKGSVDITISRTHKNAHAFQIA